MVVNDWRILILIVMTRSCSLTRPLWYRSAVAQIGAKIGNDRYNYKSGKVLSDLLTETHLKNNIGQVMQQHYNTTDTEETSRVGEGRQQHRSSVVN